jgi:hypothetical protein
MVGAVLAVRRADLGHAARIFRHGAMRSVIAVVAACAGHGQSAE